jgi:hypothetical protein
VILQDIPILTPLKLPLLEASFNDLLNPSTISHERREDRWHSYLSHLPMPKKGDKTPFIKIENGAYVMHFITHTTI